jgi:hypothetical protein
MVNVALPGESLPMKTCQPVGTPAEFSSGRLPSTLPKPESAAKPPPTAFSVPTQLASAPPAAPLLMGPVVAVR